jgi:hypothetical protein
MARILLDQADIEHGLVAALVHDIGQTAFGHDFEVVNSAIFNHEQLISKLLYDKSLGAQALADVILQHWNGIDIDRVLLILGVKREVGSKGSDVAELLPADGLARDMVNGPIDADILEYRPERFGKIYRQSLNYTIVKEAPNQIHARATIESECGRDGLNEHCLYAAVGVMPIHGSIHLIAS